MFVTLSLLPRRALLLGENLQRIALTQIVNADAL
jgi:hypothetical protein